MTKSVYIVLLALFFSSCTPIKDEKVEMKALKAAETARQQWLQSSESNQSKHQGTLNTYELYQ